MEKMKQLLTYFYSDRRERERAFLRQAIVNVQ